MPFGGREWRLVTWEGQVKLLRNEVPGAFFQLAKVSRLKQQVVEAEKHSWRGTLRNTQKP